ncbi:MAG: hypothetical protein J6W80_03195 [Kiritimatiellae bacterium]|nr:hypothetical protein [Kiritimatiellia bacterium]
MMSGSSEKGFFAAHWDWLVAGAGALALAACVAVAVVEMGVDPAAEADSAVRSLAKRTAGDGGVALVDMSAYEAASVAFEKPQKLPEPAESQGSYLASDFRVFCEADPSSEKPACGAPIPFGSKVCPICGAKQPEEAKIELDSDGDGMSDEYETSHGLDPAADDRDGDLDGDDFTNWEEFEAGTDPNAADSHPDYLDSLEIRPPLVETFLTFYFEKIADLPGGKHRFYFRDPTKKRAGYGQKGVTYSVLEGEEIGAAEAKADKNPKLATGFIVKGYEKKSERKKISAGKGERELEREVDVSVATVTRKSDGRRLDLVVGASKAKVAVESKVALVYSRRATKEFTVAQGEEIELSGVKYRIVAISGEGGRIKVTVENTATGAKKTLETKTE